jgi:hypothetical protein
VKKILKFTLLLLISFDVLAEEFYSYFCSELLQTAQSIENLHCSFGNDSEMASVCENTGKELTCRVEDDDLGVSIVVGMEITDATADDEVELDSEIIKRFPELASKAHQNDPNEDDDIKFDVVASLHCHQNRYSEGFCSVTQRKSMLFMVSDEQIRINDQLYSELVSRATKLYQSK